MTGEARFSGQKKLRPTRSGGSEPFRTYFCFAASAIGSLAPGAFTPPSPLICMRSSGDKRRWAEGHPNAAERPVDREKCLVGHRSCREKPAPARFDSVALSYATRPASCSSVMPDTASNTSSIVTNPTSVPSWPCTASPDAGLAASARAARPLKSRTKRCSVARGGDLESSGVGMARACGMPLRVPMRYPARSHVIQSGACTQYARNRRSSTDQTSSRASSP